MTVNDLLLYEIDVDRSNTHVFIDYSFSNESINFSLYRNIGRAVIFDCGKYDLAIYRNVKVSKVIRKAHLENL